MRRAAGRVITGGFHPELEESLLESLAAERERDPLAESRVVVPSNLLGIRLSRLLAERTGGHVNVRFMTFKDFALTVVASRDEGGVRALLPDSADEIIVRRLLRDGEAAQGYFSAIAERPGLSRALTGTIRSLKEACYSPDSLRETARSAGLLRPSRDNKIHEIVRFWRAYEKTLVDGGWVDTADEMTRAAEALESGRARLLPLVLYGFYDLNALQKRIVSACVALAPATVYVPFEDTDSFDFARPTLDWLESLGLTRIDLAGPDVGRLPLPEKVLILSAPGEAREAREDARELSRLLDDTEGALQDVCVLLRRPEPYSELFLEEALHLGAKPYVGTPPPLYRTREAVSLLRLGDLVREAFGRAEVMEFLSVADLAGEPGDVPAVGDWKKACVLAGITSGAETWTGKLTELRDRLAAAPAEQQFAARHGHLLDAIDALTERVSELVELLSDVPETSTVADYLDVLIRAFVAATRPSDARSRVIAAAEQLRSVSDLAGRVTFPYFMELLRTALEGPDRREERFGRGGPVVVNLMGARGLRFRTVIVPGLVEREFPAVHRQDPILLDSERERLNRARGADPRGLLPVRSASVDEERLLFRLAVGSAADALILSFPRLDPSNARPRVPSVFLLGVLAELTGERHDYETLAASPLVTRIPLSRRFPEDRMRSLTEEEFDGVSVLRAVSSDAPDEISYLIHDDTEIQRRLRMETVRWSNPFFTEYDGVTSSAAAREAVSDLSGLGGDAEVHVSPTSLEDYATCPFMFFMRHVLGVETLPEPEESLTLPPLERGSLYHEVLESFMRRARDRGNLPLTHEHRDELFATAERVARSGKWSLSGMKGARELELRKLVAGLALWLSYEIMQHGRFEPRYFEARFGGPARAGDDQELSTEEGVPFVASGGIALRFRGKIDRIDVSTEGSAARVIDYKTGKSETKGKRVLDKGRRLQLPVYLLAAERMLASVLPGTSVESAEYLYVSSPGGPCELPFSREELEAASDDLARALGLILHGIRSGMFLAYPPDPNHCRFCDYADACGSTAIALARMKNGDREARFFIEDLVEVE